MIPIIFVSLDFQLGNPNRLKIFIYRLTTKIRSTMLCLSGFELYSRWVPLIQCKGKRETSETKTIYECLALPYPLGGCFPRLSIQMLDTDRQFEYTWIKTLQILSTGTGMRTSPTGIQTLG